MNSVAEGVNYEAEQRQLKALAEAKGYGGRFEYGLIDRIEDFATRQDIVARMFGSKEAIETIASQVAIQASNTHPAFRAPMTAMNAYGAYESAAQATTGDGGGHRLESERVAESFSAVAESTQSAYMEQMEHYMARSIKAEAMGAAIGAGVQRAAAVAGAASKLAMKKAVPVTGNATTAPTTQAKPVQIRAAQTAQAAPEQTKILGPKAKYKVNTAGEKVLPKHMPRAGKDKPYDPHAVQAELSKRHGTEQVRAHTIAPSSAPNAKLAGKKHPVTGVPFDKRGFPIFDEHVVFETRIRKEVFVVKDREMHMRHATRHLRSLIDNGKIEKSKFTKEQLEQIKKGMPRVKGLTWHHHQETGRMQLIPRQIHEDTKHIGGFSL